MTHPTQFPELNQVLSALIHAIVGQLHEDVIGAYLQGSFAVGDSDEHSDCDFIFVIEEDLPESRASELERAYLSVRNLDAHWAAHLEGSFFPKDLLRDYRTAGQSIWYVDHGSRALMRSAHDNSAVVRWILREKGVALAGPPAVDLIEPIPVPALREEMYQVFRDWGMEILADPDRIGSRFYQTFVVLSYCRFLHNLHEGIVASKRAGAKWAKARLDPAWHDLIDRAWLGRPDPATSVRTPADPAELARTLAFVEEVLGRAEALAATLGLE